MPKIILGSTISIDGYINDRSGSVAPLYPDFGEMQTRQPMIESIQNTGAVVMGRNTFNMAEDPDTLADDYEYQVPIFVLTHHPPARKPRENGLISFTFVTDGIASAVAQAKAAAGSKDVTIIAAPSTARQVIEAGLADELHLDIMPVLLYGGLRLFEAYNLDPIHLERIRVVELPQGRTHLRYRIVK